MLLFFWIDNYLPFLQTSIHAVFIHPMFHLFIASDIATGCRPVLWSVIFFHNLWHKSIPGWTTWRPRLKPHLMWQCFWSKTVFGLHSYNGGRQSDIATLWIQSESCSLGTVGNATVLKMHWVRTMKVENNSTHARIPGSGERCQEKKETIDEDFHNCHWNCHWKYSPEPQIFL